MTEASGAPALGVYIHWPYCARICPYCDFNVVRDRGRVADQAALADAIVADLDGYAALTGPRRLRSIFFGGGTPSRMDPAAVARMIGACRAFWPADRLEVTLEANPLDCAPARLEALADAGVGRLSLGVQSLDDDELNRLGRDHDGAAARLALERALAVFARVSIDLIYALPGQTPSTWARALAAAAGLGAEHISPYQLTIEPGTAFHRAVLGGRLNPPGPDLAAELYETTQVVLEDLGFEAYEVSNHARGAAARARHNLICWRGCDYVGVGPGAHGRVTLADGRRATAAPRAVADYVAHVGQSGLGAALEPLSARDVALERLLMGLRTVEGVAIDDLAALAIPQGRWADLEGLVRVDQRRAVVTRKGRPVLDAVIAALADGA